MMKTLKVVSPEAIFDEVRRDFAEWMTAKEDEVWRPMMQMMKENGEFVATMFLPGVGLNDVEVMIAPSALLVKGVVGGRRLFRSVNFPRPINPEQVHAELAGGALRVNARMKLSNVRPFMPRAA